MADILPSREAVELDLAAEVLRRFGEVQLIARGGSMLPSIYPGDLLTVRSGSNADARCGEIVLCLRDGRLWIHRVKHKWREGARLSFTTQGDALPQEDPEVEESQILGRVTSVMRGGKPVKLARRDGTFTTLLRWGVRNSELLASSLLRWHSVRGRIVNCRYQTFETPSAKLPERT